MNSKLQFLEAALSMGIAFDDAIIADGNLHRSHIKNHKAGSKNGSYILHDDGIPAGWAHYFKTGLTLTWRADGKTQ